MSSNVDFGVLYGQKTTEDSLLIYSSYEDSKASPSTGDFIVLTPKDEDGIKFLSRVEAEIYDEDPIFKSQDKTLIAVQYARIAERELSERDKQKMFSYTYKVKILGTFKDEGANPPKFTTAVRKLPIVSYIARHLTPREVKYILNAENEFGAPIGHLCIGESIQRSKGEILFDINKLKSSRSMVFAKSGYGKTNFIKVLLYPLIQNIGFGKLIFDLNGEYFVRGTRTYGFGDLNDNSVRNNFVVYTDRHLPIEYENNFIHGGLVRLDMKNNLTSEDILSIGGGFSEVMKAFLLYLSEENTTDFISNIDTYCNNPKLLYENFPDFFGELKANSKGELKEDLSTRKTIMAIRKRIRHLIDETGSIHSSRSNLIEDVFTHLAQGKTVVIDLSLKDSADASIISNIIVKKLFGRNKLNFTSGNDSDIINTVIFVEEAQNVLSDEFVKSNSNPFVKIAKEGRKFGLGLVAITQRPSAISEEIRTQAENFFAFHLGNTDDVKALTRSNINFDGVISRFIQTETIKGNLYMVSLDQSFALPVRVLEFEKLVENKIYAHLRF
jgi:uncharacterized protein